MSRAQHLSSEHRFFPLPDRDLRGLWRMYVPPLHPPNDSARMRCPLALWTPVEAALPCDLRPARSCARGSRQLDEAPGTGLRGHGDGPQTEALCTTVALTSYSI